IREVKAVLPLLPYKQHEQSILDDTFPKALQESLVSADFTSQQEHIYASHHLHQQVLTHLLSASHLYSLRCRLLTPHDDLLHVHPALTASVTRYGARRVWTYDAASMWSDRQRFTKLHRISAQQTHVSALASHVGARAHRDTYACLEQCWRIVDAVTQHGDHTAVCHQTS